MGPMWKVMTGVKEGGESKTALHDEKGGVPAAISKG